MVRLLGLIACVGLAAGQMLTVEQGREAVAATHDFVRDNFYDTGYRGVDWDAARRRYEARIAGPMETGAVRGMLREMLGGLRNSHVGLITRAELQRLRNVLPVFFEKVDGRVVVSYVMRLKKGEAGGFAVGDEILSVDGMPASRMRPSEVTHLDDIGANSYVGEAGSKALVKVRRAGKTMDIEVARVHRIDDVRQWESRATEGGGVYLRLLTMGEGTISKDEMPGLWQQVAGAKYLVLDLRHCVGGDAALSNVLGGLLLGPGVVVQRVMERGRLRETVMTVDAGTRYRGRVAVLLDQNSESEPEALAAALRDHKRARLFGVNSRGAWNGWSKAGGLPHGLGMIGVPYTQSLSPNGHDYEGVGVPVDVRIKRWDSVEKAAARWAAE